MNRAAAARYNVRMDEKQEKPSTVWLLLGGAFAGVLLAMLFMAIKPSPTGAFVGFGGLIASVILGIAALALAPVTHIEPSKRQRVIHAALIAVALALWVIFFGPRLGWTHIFTLSAPICTVATIGFVLLLQRW
jgi:hypothetical protein